MEETEVLMELLKYVDFRYMAESHCNTQNISNFANSNYDLTSCNQYYILLCIKEMNAVKLFH